LDDGLERVNEPEIEHLIRFIEDEDLDFAKRKVTLLDQVDQPAWGGDQDVDSSFQGPHLLADRDAAERGRHGQARKAAVGLCAVGDLGRELARRREDQHAAGGRTRHSVGSRQTVDRREHERRRLAGAGLRDSEQVAATQKLRDGLSLDRSCG
jgi:hypothetical protein